MDPLGGPVSDRDSCANAFPDASELGEYLCAAFERGGRVDFDRADQKLWSVALNWLVDKSMLDVAKFTVENLSRVYPDLGYFKTVAALLALLPARCQDASFASFNDEPEQEVQVVPHARANVALLGFSGSSKRLGLSLNLIHRWFGQLGAHVVYLRDFQGGLYDHGIRSLAADFSGTVQALRELVDKLEAQRIVCYGNSLGGYGALRYALELRAEAVLSLAGPTNLTSSLANSDAGNARVQSSLARRRVAPGVNLRPLYQSASYVPRTHIVYAQNNSFDRLQAFNFFGLPRFSVEVLPGATAHNVLLHLINQRRYERLLGWLVDPDRTSGMP